MTFLIRLVMAFVMFVLIAGAISMIIVGTVAVVNALVKWVANRLGYEVGDFFQWLKSKFPKRKKAVDEERP